MSNIQSRILSCAAAAAVGLCLLSEARAASVSMYISAPGQQTSTITGVTTETFNSLTTGNRTTNYNSTIGTYVLSATTPFNIQDANQYGGASNSRYMTFGAQSGTTNAVVLNLTSPQTYFGMWWSAGDVNNGISLYSGGQLIARFATSSINTMLQAGSVFALNGTEYQSSAYFGNPNNSQNNAEPYAYIHFFASTGTFDRIVFDNSGMTSTGFENDNHSIHATRRTPRPDYVGVPEVPEPSTLVLVALPLAAILYKRRGSFKLSA